MYHLGKKYFLFCFALLAVAQDTQAQYQGCAWIDQIPRIECESLERLFEQTNGRFWRNNRGWLRSNQPCNWFGVTCTSSSWPRNVISLNLSSNDLTGSIPGELSQLSELRQLVIHNRAAGIGALFGQIGGTLPSVLSNLDKLEILWLSNNVIGGSLPDDFFQMESLRVLLLDQNNFTGPIPESYGQLRLLEEIDLSRNRLAGEIPDEFVNLSRLRELLVSSNLLFGSIPDELGNLLSLRKLELDNNDLTGPIPASLTSLKRLVSLKLNSNNLNSPISPLQAQEFGKIAECYLLQEPTQSNARELCLPSFPIDQPLGELCGLPESTNCSRCQGMDSISKEECFALESVYTATRGGSWDSNNDWFANTEPCSWDGISCLDQMVTEILLRGNNLRGSIPGDLAQLSSVRSIDFSNNLLAGPIPEELGQLEEIEFLDLSQNKLAGVLPLSVVDLASRSSICALDQDVTDLCFPDAPPYSDFGIEICGITARSTCQAQILSSVDSFVSLQDGQRVVLSWQVDQIPSNLVFRVEQERRGDFVEIGLVDGGDELEYDFILTNPQPGRSVFRIQLVDQSGTVKVGPQVNSVFVPSNFLVSGPFPNPATDRSTISIAVENDTMLEAYLVDSVGRRVRTIWKSEFNAGKLETIDLDLRDLSSGLHFIHLVSTESQVSLTLQIIR